MQEDKYETFNVDDMSFDTSVHSVVHGDLVLDTKQHELTLDEAVETLYNHQRKLSLQDEAIGRLFTKMSDAECGIKLTWIVCFVNVLFSVGIALKISGMF